MKKNKEIIVLEGAYILTLLVIFILPFYTAPEYSIIKNTTSQLGAQNTPNAWIMNLTFVSMGISSIIAGWRYYKGFAFYRLWLILFGISLTLTAFFNHAPVNPEIQYYITEDGWHSYFAFTTGLSFTILAIATAFIVVFKKDKLLAISAGILATVLSILMFEVDQIMGIWQRLIFIISFGWMIRNFRKTETKTL
ncbi:MAG: DUF998 domain-containing protein [Bacteroidetes bacterium]|nr:MAG: DUF998 domain-containing protein [Bacteroidota bacterium]